jgi:hypothetical protein
MQSFATAAMPKPIQELQLASVGIHKKQLAAMIHDRRLQVHGPSPASL